MNPKEARRYFQEMGELLRSEPDRNERQRYFQQTRLEPQYREAFVSLRQEVQLNRRKVNKQKAKPELFYLCPFISPFGGKPATMNEIVEGLAGEHVEHSVVEHTSYGAKVVEFKVKGERYVIVPLRAESAESDFSEALRINAKRVFETGTGSTSFSPLIIG